MITSRLSRRLLRHHFPLAFTSVGTTAALYFKRPYPQVIRDLLLPEPILRSS